MFEGVESVPHQESKKRIDRVQLQTGTVEIHRTGKIIQHLGKPYEQITALHIQGPKGSVNVFDLFDHPNEPRPEVMLRRQRESRCATDKKTYITANWIESELDLVAILHEIGHVKQLRDPKFVEANELEKISRKMSTDHFWQKIEPIVHRILQAHPEQASALDLDKATQKLLDEYKQLQYPSFRQDEIMELQQGLDYGDEYKRLEAEYDALLERELPNPEREMELRAALKPFFQRIQALIYLPENDMERDATRRAFRWMREIRERTGVDLFVELRLKNSQRITPEAGVDAEEERAVSAIQELADALCTYTSRSKLKDGMN